MDLFINYLIEYILIATIWDNKRIKVSKDRIQTIDISIFDNGLKVESNIILSSGKQLSIKGNTELPKRKFSQIKNELLKQPFKCLFLYNNKQSNSFKEFTPFRLQQFNN